MESWFTVEEIDCETFAISEYKHWEETHCYLLCGEKSAVLIDTGLGVSNIKQIVDRLTKLPITVVTTHVHWDHIGGHKYFDNIAVYEAEKEWLSCNFPIPLQVVQHNLEKQLYIEKEDNLCYNTHEVSRNRSIIMNFTDKLKESILLMDGA
ncbi:MAG: MBL fold metallo-hydrolase, partial [Eubacteriales bacterium]|nr:MBL fold metallo-hydrolase [Eubacteriales bacterium]